MSKVIYASNKKTVGDGLRVARVSNGGQKFEFLVDDKTEKYSEVVMVSNTGSGVPTPPVIGQTVAVNETDLRDKIDAVKDSGKTTTIGIKDGHFDQLTLSNIDMGGGARLNIVAENRRMTDFERIRLINATKNITFNGIGTCPKGVPAMDISPKGAVMKTYGFDADPSTSEIEVLDGRFRGSLDSGDHPNWPLKTWQDYALGAVFLQGQNSLIEYCYAEGVNFGFNTSGDGSIARKLFVFGASGDGFRCAADHLIYEDCLVTDQVYKDDDNHPDAFQAFKGLGGSSVRGVKGLGMRRVAGIEWTVNYRNPLRVSVDNQNVPGIMQGLGFHASGHEDMWLEDIYMRTPVKNGIHIGSVKNLYGRRWNILSSDYAVRADKYPVKGQPGANYDPRYPQINIDGFTGFFDVDDVIVGHKGFGTVLPITNHRVGTDADYSAAEPAWIAPLRAIAA